jgi:hypothetical protein
LKRELRLPSKGYDMLRQQVQARRGSTTNRDPEETAEPAVAPLGATDANPPETAGEQFAVEPSAADGEATKRLAPADRQAPPVAAREAQGPAAAMAKDGRADRRSSKPGKPADTPVARLVAAERITLKVNVRAPAPGLFPFYDRVIETMPPRRALPLLLAKAFEDLEAEVADGATLELKDYASDVGAARISTSRTMDHALFQKMRAQIDPYELMRKTSIGTAIARSALCLYLTKRS